jgi:hypothetical protein
MRCLLLVLCLSIPVLLTAKDDYQPGDTLYVWARSGLQLRAAPNLQAAVLRSLPLNTAVRVLERTDQPLTLSVLPPAYQNAHPLLLRGYWVAVETGGQRGYLFDAYLLDLPSGDGPAHGLIAHTVLQTVVPADTLRYTANTRLLRYRLANGIPVTYSANDKAYYFALELPGYTLEEAFVCLQRYYPGDAPNTVTRNWARELHLHFDDGFCRWIIREGAAGCTLTGICSC